MRMTPLAPLDPRAAREAGAAATGAAANGAAANGAAANGPEDAADEPWPGDRASRARAVERAIRPIDPEVHRVLVAQNERLADSPARTAHLDALARGAAVVVTGQQVGLFLGPLYTIHKAATAVVVARTLAAETGLPVVPMFWLQTEDHDLAEIASCGVAGQAQGQMIEAPIEADNRVSIAHRTLPDEIANCLERLEAALGDGANVQQHLERLRRHYRAGATWSRAFAGLLGELFAPEGLVVIDPRGEPALPARLIAPIHARALDDAAPIADALITQARALEAAGAPVPIHVRPGAPLAFYHPDGAHGPRVRLEPAGDSFVEVGGERVHTRDELRAALQGDVRRFSTSALLRPIVQDSLLPTVAYVGGPSEVAYFAQLPPLYKAFDRRMPLIVPRARFRIIDLRTRKLLERLGLAPDDAARPEAELLARLGPAARDTEEISRRLLDPFVAAHAELAASLPDAGPEITRALAKTRGSVERSVGKLIARLERARLYADAARVDAVRRLRAVLAPDGAPQERWLGLPALAARIGDRAVVAAVLAAVDPFNASLQELTP